jgi:hypothetical protein
MLLANFKNSFELKKAWTLSRRCSGVGLSPSSLLSAQSCWTN